MNLYLDLDSERVDKATAHTELALKESVLWEWSNAGEGEFISGQMCADWFNWDSHFAAQYLQICC